MKRIILSLCLFLLSGIVYSGQIKADKLYYVWVDKVNVRDKPSTTAKVLTQLEIGEDVVYTGKKTKNKTTVTLQGKKYTRPWAMVKTKDGKTGWVHAGTLQKKTTLVCWLSKVNVRDTPDLKAKAVASLNEKDEMTYLGYATDELTKVTLRGKTYNEPFYKVKMKDGKVVWVHGATVKNKIVAPSASSSKTVTVKAGSDLQKAINSAEKGTILILEEGTYKQNSAIKIEGKQDITIEGDGDVQIICTSQYDDVLTIMKSENITIKDVTMKHHIPVRDSCSGMVISVSGCDGVTFDNCDINGCGWMGIYSYNNSGITVRNCYLHDNYEYVMNFSDSDKDILVEDCNIEENGGGIVINWGTKEILSDDSPHDWLQLKGNSWGNNQVRFNQEDYNGEDYYEGDYYEGY